MTAGRGVTAEELIRALKRRRTALPAEIGTFVVLETCEVLLTRGSAAVALQSVQITDEGLVRIEGASQSDEAGAARALHAMLTSLLVAAGPAPAPALMRLVEEGPQGGTWTLAQIRDDLEASLVPLNRHASRRVLARLVRETGWNDRQSRSATPTFSELDAELNSFLGVENDAPEEPDEPERLSEPPGKREKDATVRDVVDLVDPYQGDVHMVEDAPAPPSLRVVDVARTQIEASPAPGPGSLSTSGQFRDLDGLDGPDRAPAGRSTWLGLSLVVLALALLGITLGLKPEVLDKLTSGSPSAEAAESKGPTIVHKVPPGGDLVVRVAPDRAQVLRFVGRGPVTVPHLPRGVAHEFVAIADGMASTRAVVPGDAEWESGEGEPRYELAMQLGQATSPGAPLDLGDTVLPRNVGQPSGSLGTVRIITTPRAAKVYQVIGFAPEARVEDLPLDKTEELIVYRPGFAHVVRVVAPSDYLEAGGRKVANISIELSPLRKKP